METIKITTPVEKKEVELKSFLTGGDKLDLADLENSSTREKAEKTISVAVVSVGGSNEDILKSVKDLHGKDFDFVMEKITEVVGGSVETKKKKIE